MASCVDPVTIAYRLNHADPRTTIEYYSAWRPRGDQHAVSIIADTMPEPPTARRERTELDPSAKQTTAYRPSAGEKNLRP